MKKLRFNKMVKHPAYKLILDQKATQLLKNNLMYFCRTCKTHIPKHKYTGENLIDIHVMSGWDKEYLIPVVQAKCYCGSNDLVCMN